MKFAAGIHLFLIGLTFCIAQHTVEDETGNANAYVDQLIGNLLSNKNFSSKFDPYDLPDYSGDKYQFKDLQMKGFSSLYRKGDCTFKFDGATMKWSAEIGLKHLLVEGKWRAKLLMWFDGTFSASMTCLAAKLDLSMTGYKVGLDAFKVTQFGEIKIQDITGFPKGANYLLRQLANNISQMYKKNIVSGFEATAANAIRDFLQKNPAPGIMVR